MGIEPTSPAWKAGVMAIIRYPHISLLALCKAQPLTVNHFKSGRQDLNLRPFGPKPNALPTCATPRIDQHSSAFAEIGQESKPTISNLRSLVLITRKDSSAFHFQRSIKAQSKALFDRNLGISYAKLNISIKSPRLFPKINYPIRLEKPKYKGILCLIILLLARGCSVQQPPAT